MPAASFTQEPALTPVITQAPDVEENLRILVVDDNLEIADSQAIVLQLDGLEEGAGQLRVRFIFDPLTNLDVRVRGDLNPPEARPVSIWH